MGTRSLICVRLNKTWVLAQYCQWNGHLYQDEILAFLTSPGNVARLRAGFAHVYKPSSAELADCDKKTNEKHSRLQAELRQLARSTDPASVEEFTKKNMECFHVYHSLYPSLSRDTGPDILGLVAEAKADCKVPVKLDLEFANASVACEWAYLVDLDAGLFKVFEGSELKNDDHDFKDIGPPHATVPRFRQSYTIEQAQDV
ncbi:hypothetical protein F4780DRAFT_29137 [Xylariomycetidae sp. FL0641]|nr:hypothetical protein F4780DRAFT_29137 [Xylariomycetidae sp. FL0641]